MLMLVSMRYPTSLKCRMAPVSTKRRFLSRCRQCFVSKHIVGQIPQADFGSRPGYTDASHYQITGHHRLNTKYMFNSAACFRPSMIAAFFSLCQFLMAVTFALYVVTKSTLRKHLQSVFGSVRRIGIYIAACIRIIEQVIKYMAIMGCRIGNLIVTDQLVFYILIQSTLRL